MEGCGCVRRDVKHLIKFLHELRDELQTSVGDDDLGHSMLGVDVVSENSGQPSAESSTLQAIGMMALENRSTIIRIASCP